jgi:hypothetical protein
MAASPVSHDFSQDGDGNLVRRDCSEIEAGRRLELREPLGSDAALREFRSQRFRLFPAADEGHIFRLDRKRCLHATSSPRPCVANTTNRSRVSSTGSA